jgi:hypothetical protein
MSRISRFAAPALVCALPLVGLLTGCAGHREPVGVPIDERARPPQPHVEPAPASADTVPPVPPPRPMTPSGEESMRGIVVRDTSAVSRALKRCAGKTLLPEQESTFIATQKLLAQTREALQRGDVARARSLARNARQLVSSLDCP